MHCPQNNWLHSCWKLHTTAKVAIPVLGPNREIHIHSFQTYSYKVLCGATIHHSIPFSERDTIATSTFNMIPSTSYTEKQVNSLVTISETSHVTMDPENTYQTTITSKETEPHLGHEPPLFLIVKLLGVALGIGVIIILGLICLFLYNKRQRDLMNLQQHQFYW